MSAQQGTQTAAGEGAEAELFAQGFELAGLAGLALQGVDAAGAGGGEGGAGESTREPRLFGVFAQS